MPSPSGRDSGPVSAADRHVQRSTSRSVDLVGAGRASLLTASSSDGVAVLLICRSVSPRCESSGVRIEDVLRVLSRIATRAWQGCGQTALALKPSRGPVRDTSYR